MRKRWGTAVVLGVFGALSVACTNSAGEPSGPSTVAAQQQAEEISSGTTGIDVRPSQPNSLILEPQLEQANTARGFVWPDETTELSVTGEDGTLYTLVFPAGAVLSPVEISMTPVSGFDGLPEGVDDVHAVHLQPEGLTLMTPAQLTIRPVNGAEGATAFATFAQGRDFHFSPSMHTNGEIEIPLIHFSDPGMANVGSNVIHDIQETYPPVEEAGYWISQAAEALSIENNEGRGNRLYDIFTAWYQDIRPWLSQAGNDSSFIDQAVRQYTAWNQFSLVVSNIDDVAQSIVLVRLDPIRTEARALLANGLWHAISEASNRCQEHQDPDQAVRMLRWAAVVETLGLWGEDDANSPHLLELDHVVLMLGNCMDFNLDFDSKLVMKGKGVFTHNLSSLVPLIPERLFERRAFSNEHLKLEFSDWDLDYDRFQVTGIPGQCQTNKGNGEVETAVYFGLNFYDYPPRLDDHVVVLIRFPKAPWEEIDCGGTGSMLPRTKLWNDMFHVLHLQDQAYDREAFLFVLDVTRQPEAFATYQSVHTLEDLVDTLDQSPNPMIDPSQFDTVNETSTILLEYDS